MLDQVGQSFDAARIIQLRDGLAQLERNTRELQESVMRIRMLPIAFSFNRFPRLVHDLSSQLGKKVELKLSGEHTELDKTVLEKMSDPLVHLVRNALDHGIEMPAQRLAAGKPEVGLLKLHAFHQSGSIIIQISDDGAGIDTDKVLQKARNLGLIHGEENLTEEQLYELIFHPGLSTATQVSDLSGRGVGMDVVRRNIRSLGGTIDVKSKRGKGSTFNIRLPLTLAILDGQLVRIGHDIYILSLLSIIESLRVNSKYVNALAGRAEVYKLRDEYIPILRLYELFDIPATTTKLEEGLLVIVEGDGQKIGLFVDELLSQQQIVIKSLESNYKQIQGVSGATILGDGNVALILDVAGIIQLFHHRTNYLTRHHPTLPSSHVATMTM
jgi:two-component system chemotaxis sensor kinase CheA